MNPVPPVAVPPQTAALRLAWRPFHFSLPRALVTAQGAMTHRCGWLLRLEGGDGG